MKLRRLTSRDNNHVTYTINRTNHKLKRLTSRDNSHVTYTINRTNHKLRRLTSRDNSHVTYTLDRTNHKLRRLTSRDNSHVTYTINRTNHKLRVCLVISKLGNNQTHKPIDVKEGKEAQSVRLCSVILIRSLSVVLSLTAVLVALFLHVCHMAL